MLMTGLKPEWTLVIDSELMDCFDRHHDGCLRNDWMTGDFPLLNPGDPNAVMGRERSSVTIPKVGDIL